MAWYRTGTVALTNGSPVITGTGTSFVANVQIGHAINLPDGKAYEVAAITADTQITLGSNYLGATATGQTYSVQPNQGFAQQAAAALAMLLSQFTAYISTALAGRFGDGTAATPGITFATDQDTGIYRAGENMYAVTTGGVQRTLVDPTGTFSILKAGASLLTAVLGGGTGDGFDLRVFNGVAAGASGSSKAKIALLYSGNAANEAASIDFRRGGGGTDGWVALRTTSADRLVCDPAGAVLPGADNTQPFGSGSLRWSTLYAGTSAINTSDEREKEQIGGIPDDWLDAWGAVEWSRFKFIDAVAAKGDGARWHIGLIAQRVDAAFTAAGIDAMAIGLLCHDEWEAEPPGEPIPAQPAIAEVCDADGVVVTRGCDAVPARPGSPGRSAGDRFGLRYEECFAIEAAWQRRELTRLAAGIAALQHA